MTRSFFDWTEFLLLAGQLAAGVLLGLLYFRNIWWSTRRFALAGDVMTTIGWTVCRFGLLVGLLTFASRQGALPLLVTAFGPLIARPIVIRSISKAAS